MAAALLMAALIEYLLGEWEDDDKEEVKPKTYEQIMAEARARGSRNED